MKASLFAIATAPLMTVIFSTNVIAEGDNAKETIALVKQYQADCLNCHRTNVKIVGPSWNDISARYKGDVNAQQFLVEKVINGGRGKWDSMTNGLPMTSHLTKPTREEIEKIVASILKM